MPAKLEKLWKLWWRALTAMQSFTQRHGCRISTAKSLQRPRISAESGDYVPTIEDVMDYDLLGVLVSEERNRVLNTPNKLTLLRV
ncbi:MAG: hypothetical protein ACLRVT_03215 [Oscillospiraceae bacterium]